MKPRTPLSDQEFADAIYCQVFDCSSADGDCYAPAVFKALNEISKEYRDLITYKLKDRLTAKQITEKTGLSTSQIKLRFGRAVRILRHPNVRKDFSIRLILIRRNDLRLNCALNKEHARILSEVTIKELNKITPDENGSRVYFNALDLLQEITQLEAEHKQHCEHISDLESEYKSLIDTVNNPQNSLDNNR